MDNKATTQQNENSEDPRIKEAEEISKEFNLKLENIYLKFMDKLENIKKSYLEGKKYEDKESSV